MSNNGYPDPRTFAGTSLKYRMEMLDRNWLYYQLTGIDRDKDGYMFFGVPMAGEGGRSDPKGIQSAIDIL